MIHPNFRSSLHFHRSCVSSGPVCNCLLYDEDESIPAVFCEENGETLTAQTVANETGAALYALTMGMGEGEMGCTDAIYKNIDTIREALS